MDLSPVLDKLEDKFDGEWADNRDAITEALSDMHKQVLEVNPDAINHFTTQVSTRFGGIYIPYLFWDQLSRFMHDQDKRIYLQKLIGDFANSDFEEVEQKRMKPLLITYFNREKQFELNKLIALVIEKAHPFVKEYFQKLLAFVDKNHTSTEMYCEKFDLLKGMHPDFSLMAMPVTQLKDRF